jgi:protein Tob/BTG
MPGHHHQGHSPSPSITSLASVSSSGSGGSNSKHRRQRTTSTTAAVVDPSKASVTAYDGGKTKVMTGGVMLGAITSGNKKKRAY